MKIEMSNLQKIYVLNDILLDLLDESVIDEFEFGKLMGAYSVCKGIALGTFDREELGL